MNTMIQSNSIRGKELHKITDMVVNEILADVLPIFGPGATDAFLTKNGAPYYTRDGMEVMESLIFDTEIANSIHHIFFQAAYRQGKAVGDGTTTVEVFYCYLYKQIRERMDRYKLFIDESINEIREVWKEYTDLICERLKDRAVPLDNEKLKSMLYTCTQDPDLTMKLYTNLGDALIAGAYIMPRLSDIQTDFQTTVYNRPVFKATKQFSVRPIGKDGNNTIDDAVVYYCHGTLDIAHPEVLFSMLVPGTVPNKPDEPIYTTQVILCHGTTDCTRRTLRALLDLIRSRGIDVNSLNNLVIFTLDEYRKFSDAEFEDIATIITDQPGLGGIVNALTFETLLYRCFFIGQLFEDNWPDKIDALETFDVDIQIIDKMHQIASLPYQVVYDEVEGITLNTTLSPNALKRFDDLQKEIAEEKSEIRKVSLQKRLRRTYGMFIDVEIGSGLIKDSQRKFELILDAIVSSAEAGRDGVLVGNSILHTLSVMREIYPAWYDNQDKAKYIFTLRDALMDTILAVLKNAGINTSIEHRGEVRRWIDENLDKNRIKNFNLHLDDIWPTSRAEDEGMITVLADGVPIEIQRVVVEPVNIMIEIIRNSILPIEVAKTEVFHISGSRGFMNNFIDSGEEETGNVPARHQKH